MIDTCWGFAVGNCVFGDTRCWFRHSPLKSDIKCKLCSESFGTKPEYMEHRKEKHEHTVPLCENSSSCKYEFCWFIHDKRTEKYEFTNEVEHMENNVVIERLFGLVEKISERMNKLEQKE